ncbi:MAG: hypothetical protein ACO1O3_14740 [Sphingobium sp.]
MTDIDVMLAQLRDGPVHPGLTAIDAAVMDELAERAQATPALSGKAFGMAAAMALVVGIAGSALPGGEVRAAPISPLGAPPMLAPSTLLGNAR